MNEILLFQTVVVEKRAMQYTSLIYLFSELCFFFIKLIDIEISKLLFSTTAGQCEVIDMFE